MRRRQARLAHATILAVALPAAFLAGRGEQVTRSVDTPAVREAAALLASLDSLEAELTAGRAGTEHHTELARRHDQVTAIACDNAIAHLRSSEELARRALNRRRTPRPEPTVSAPDEPAGAGGHRAEPGPHGHPPPARQIDAISP